MDNRNVRFFGMRRGMVCRVPGAPEPSSPTGGGGFVREPSNGHGGTVADADAHPPARTSSQSVPAPERSGGATRRRVIEAGARVFADLGFHAATKERIGAAAGFSHQTVRDYFRTKEGLLGAIVSESWKTVHGAIEAASGAGLGAVDQLMAGFDALDTLVHARPAEARCVLHEAQIAGPRGGPLTVDEEREFKRTVESIVSVATGLRGTMVTARADAVVAAMSALVRPSMHSGGEYRVRYGTDEARSSFRRLVEAMLQRTS